MKRVLKIIVIMLFIFSSKVWANEVKVKNYKLQNNVEMNGIYSKHSFNFYVDEHWKVTGDSYVYLNINVSDMIKYKNSSITVYINGSPIGSINIYDKKNIQQAIPIQVEKLNVGFNNIKIVAFKMIDGEDRYEKINIANYIELLSDSYVHIEYYEDNIEPSINKFPYPFLKLGNENKFDTVILVGDEKEEYLSMLYLSAAFGKYDNYSNLNLNVKHIKDFNVDDVDKNIIILSSYWGLGDEFRKEIKDDEKVKIADRAMVKIVKSPYNENKYMLLITSFDSKKIVEATKSLGDSNFIKEIEEDRFFIDEYRSFKEDDKKDFITLKDLGFKDAILNSFLNDFNVVVDIPKEERLKDNAYIELKYRYSTLLDFDKSTMCVYINGLPYQDKRLSEKNSNSDSMKISLKEFKNNSRLNIGVKFNLVSKTKYKELNIDDDLFAVLLDSSYIYIPTEYQKRMDFRYYPVPLVEKGKFNNLNLVIPKNIENSDLTSISNIFAYIGHSIKTLEGLSINFVFDKSKNNLVYGVDINDELNQKMNIFIENGIYKVKNKLNINLSEDDAVIEIADGITDGTFIIAFLAKDKEKLKNIERYLSDFDFVEKLKGNLCVINQRGMVKCYELKNKNFVDNNKRLILGFLITTSIIVLILLIFVAIKYRE